MDAKKITIIRHGRTDWNAEGRVQGSIDRPLDEVGMSEAKILGDAFFHLPIGKIVSSDLERAYHTAKIIAEKFSSSVEMHPSLREVSFGSIEGMLWEDFRLEYKEKILAYESLSWEERKKFRYTDTSETYGEALARVLPFLQDLCLQSASQHILVITHGGVMKALLAELAGFDDRKVRSQNTGFLTLKFKQGCLVLDHSQGIDLNFGG
ncbi:MAG: histidine phosphatase family protein [Chlamydiae bacterium]|nr:histidine phosphatase family protein [Chlamydiota bacterium]